MENGTDGAGLTSAQARERLAKYGRNELIPEKKETAFRKIANILREPMFVLLLAAAVIYFLLGEPGEGAVMLVFVVGVISIDAVQTWRTDKTLRALKDLSAPAVTVIRDGAETRIPSLDLVPGDVMLIREGVKIPADGYVLRLSDLCVDESSLTGEPEGVWKTPHSEEGGQAGLWRRDYCYAGTLALQGTGTVLVDKTGQATVYGGIGGRVAEAPDRPTPLEKQTGRLVKLCAFIAAGLLLLVSLITFGNLAGQPLAQRAVHSILSGITLAMAMIPEEFPVILTVVLSMGAWRLAKKKSLVRRLPAVETLGAVSVLCVDKTGTITLNHMTVQEALVLSGDREALAETMGLACETEAYDPMEKAMLAYCEGEGMTADRLYGGELLLEYPFTNERKAMGHVWRQRGKCVIAAKGSAEGLLPLCSLPEDRREAAEAGIRELSEKGLRVIAVGRMELEAGGEIPASLGECGLTLCGLVGLADPPRPSVKADIATCQRAGVRVVMITGDSGATAAAIARQIGITHADRLLAGSDIDGMDDGALREAVRDAAIFSRVTPEHKTRIVKALKDSGQVVAMTGDGVNDAAALKYADIGVAMGGRGSEAAREAADLILMDDNFSTIVDTVRDGRRIYDNIRKAVGYVFAIHIPIALASLLAPLLGVGPESLLLLPLHVVLLELIIDPTCSIVLERQLAERNIMERPPRRPGDPLLSAGLLVKSVIQGLTMFAASFGAYWHMLRANGGDETLARSMGLAVLMLANLFLVDVNSSQTDSALRSAVRLAKDRVMWLVHGGTALLLAAVLYTPMSGFLRLAPLSPGQLLAALGLAAVSVFWYEAVKGVKRKRRKP